MNGFSEASIVCGGNIGDRDCFLYLAKVKQQLQKILKTDREDLLIQKVERWTNVRVTFRLPPAGASILRSIVEQKPDALRSLGIQSVQVDAGGLVPIQTTSSPFTAVSQVSSEVGQTSRTSNATFTNGSSSSDRTGLLTALIENSDETISNENQQQQQQQRPYGKPAESAQQPQTANVDSHQRQNLLGYLLGEPDQLPTPISDRHQQPPAPPPQFVTSNVGVEANSNPSQDSHRQPPCNSWNQLTTAPRPPTNVYGESPHFGGPMAHYHQQRQQHQQTGAPGNAAIGGRLQHEQLVLGDGELLGNHRHSQRPQMPAHVNSSPLLVGLLQQNSPPSSSSTSSFSCNPQETGVYGFVGYENQGSGTTDSTSLPPATLTTPTGLLPATSCSIVTVDHELQSPAKKQKRASPAVSQKLKKTQKNSTANKKANLKRVGAGVVARSLDESGEIDESLHSIMPSSASPSQMQQPFDQRSIAISCTRIDSVIDAVVNASAATGFKDEVAAVSQQTPTISSSSQPGASTSGSGTPVAGIQAEMKQDTNAIGSGSMMAPAPGIRGSPTAMNAYQQMHSVATPAVASTSSSPSSAHSGSIALNNVRIDYPQTTLLVSGGEASVPYSGAYANHQHFAGREQAATTPLQTASPTQQYIPQSGLSAANRAGQPRAYQSPSHSSDLAVGYLNPVKNPAAKDANADGRRAPTTVNGDMYLTATTTAVQLHAAGGSPVGMRQQHQQYATSGAREVGRAPRTFDATNVLISTTTGGCVGGTDHDYLLMPPETTSVYQPPLANDMPVAESVVVNESHFYEYSSPASADQRSAVYYETSSFTSEGVETTFGEVEVSRGDLVAKEGQYAQTYPHSQALHATQLTKQQQALSTSRHRQSWSSNPRQQPQQLHGDNTYENNSEMRDTIGSTNSTHIDNYSPHFQHDSVMLSSYSQRHHQHAARQQPAAADALITGHLPAR